MGKCDRVMNAKNKIRLLFATFLLLGIYSVNNRVEFYPSIQFPIFESPKKGVDISFKKVQLIDIRKGTSINLAELVKPYDKRLLLFGSMALENKQFAPLALTEFQKIYNANFEDSAILAISVTDTTIIFNNELDY